MNNTKTIIIIENDTNTRDILYSAFDDKYNILTAETTSKGLELLNDNADVTVLLFAEINMLLEDNNFLLDTLKNENRSSDIPVIAVKSGDISDDEISCLEPVVTDFISGKLNGKVIRKRAENIIDLREISAMHKRVEKNTLTGAYNKEFFMEYLAKRMKDEPDTAYDLVCLEMESYDLLHGRYGVEICNEFLRSMVEGLNGMLPPNTIIGRLDDSQLVMLIGHVPFEMHKFAMFGCLNIVKDSPFPSLAINAGVYSNIDHSLLPEVICRNAQLPIDNIRYRYDSFIAQYDDEIIKKVAQQKFLIDNMYQALEEKQFKVYYQPKYDLKNEAAGAEALVRWIHPEKGFMNPGEFIPFFEQNGFIFKLDKYILESVCIDLRRWLDEGKPVVPVSVNVSQTDFDQSDLDVIFETIVDKYNIPHEYVHFEITESSEAPDAMRKSIAVSNFRKKGFKVELDDFGVGYSTLSILGKMPVDVMKIDMSLIRHMFEPENKAILEAALFTAMRLDIKVVAEGVETIEQYEALRQMCEDCVELSIQGYYFSKPLPVEQFEMKLSER